MRRAYYLYVCSFQCFLEVDALSSAGTSADSVVNLSHISSETVT